MQKLLKNEVFLYLVSGVLTTIVYMMIRTGLFEILPDATLVTVIANIVAVLFAFVLNDRMVFRQQAIGWLQRLLKFSAARLVTFFLDIGLARLLVDYFPHIIGQFVHNDVRLVNMIEMLIAQALIVVLNYVLSKLFVFKDTSTDSSL